MPISKGEMIFDEATHTYAKDGQAYISVTQLLKKHGLLPDYSKIKTETLRKASEKGTFIHSEIEQYIKNGTVGFSSELADFIEICDERRLEPDRAEFIVYNDEYKVAGRVDLSGLTALNKCFIGDVKTTSTLHTESLAWQLSLYAFLGEMIVSEAYGFHLRPNNKSKLVPVTLKRRDEIIQLLEAEKVGTKYEPQKQQVIIANHDKILRLQEDLVLYKNCMQAAEQELEKYKEFLLGAMKKNNVKTWETDDLLITYVAPKTKISIDGKRLKEERPEIAQEYRKTTIDKEYVQIKLRKKNESAG